MHAKVCVVDDVWATIGSDNLNRRSWSHDSELNIAVLDETLDERDPRDPGGLGDGARLFARDLRLQLWREHTDGDVPDDELIDPERGIAALQRSADRPGGLARRAAGRDRARRAAAAASSRSAVVAAAAVVRTAVPGGLRPGRSTEEPPPRRPLVRLQAARTTIDSSNFAVAAATSSTAASNGSRFFADGCRMPATLRTY